MASGVTHPHQQGTARPEHSPTEYERFIEDRLEKTRRYVKTVDLVTRLVALLVGTLAYLLTAALIDHWLLDGGLGFAGRLLLWAVLVVGFGFFFVRYLLPLFLYQVSPVFAAYTIEQYRPTFKNGLINFLLLNRHREQFERDVLARRVLEGLEHRTASELSQVAPEGIVDRTLLLRLTYALAILVTFCCLYVLISPKNPLTSFSRVIWPWASIEAPTRAHIRNIEPGDAEAYQGETVAVFAEVYGLEEGEQPHLYFSTADGQVVDQAIPMTQPEGDWRYRADLPPGSFGLQQDLEYYLKAGDAKTRPFHLQMQIPLSIVVDRVDYRYPKYTGLAPRTIERQGDLRALEGTLVTVHAKSTRPIGRAWIEFDGDPRNSLLMEARGDEAQVEFALRMDPNDPARPAHNSYQLRFTDAEGRENRRPIRHRIDVVPDLRPDVRFIDRPEDGAAVAESGSLELKVKAEDPDFGLRRVQLHAEKDARAMLIRLLLNKPKPEKEHTGPFESTYRFEPKKLGLKAGDRLLYWAEAQDNKEDHRGPAANVAETERRWLVIVSDDQQQQAQQPQEKPGDAQQGKPQAKPDQGQGKPDQKPQDQQQQDPQQDPNNQGQQKPGDQQQQKPGEGPGQQKPDQMQNQGQKPDQQDPQQKQDPSQPNQGENAKNQRQNGDQGAQQKGSQSQQGNQQGQESGEPQEQKPVDQTNAGEAFNRIQDYMKEKEKEQQQNQQQQKPEKQNPGEQQEQKPSQSGGQQQKPDQGAQQKPDQQQGQEPKPGDQQQKGQDQQQGQEPKQGSQEGGQQQGMSEQQNAEQPKQQGEKKPSDQQQPGNQQQTGEQKPGDKQSGQGQQGQGEQAPKPEEKGGAGQQSGSQQKPGQEQTGQQKPGEQSTGGNSGEQKPQDSAGQKPSDKQEGSGGQDASNQKPEQQNGQGEKPQPGATSGEMKPGEKPNEKTSSGAQSAEKPQGEQPGAQDAMKPEQQQGTEGTSGEKTTEAQRNQDNDQGKAQPKPGQGEEKGQGAQSKNPGEKEKPGQPSKPGEQEQQAEGGNPEGVKQEAGAGTTPKKQEPTATPHQPSQDREKSGTTPQAKEDRENPEPSSAAAQRKTSDSKSDTQGNLTGGGGQGGGQQSKNEGTGNPGSTTDSEQGGDQSKQQGEGDAGSRGGNQMQADRKTGTPSDQQGEGSGSQQKPGEKPSQQPVDPTQQGKPGEKPDGQPQDQQPGDAAKGGPPGKPGDGTGQKGSTTAGNPMRGGVPGEEPDQTQQAADNNALPPDEANLDYAKQQTNMALRTLEEALENDDRELLQRLGWDKAQAENFYKQWREMMNRANAPGPQGDAAKKDLDRALKSLGLRPDSAKLRTKQGSVDAMRQLDSGRFAPPSGEWSELMEAYTKGVSGARE